MKKRILFLICLILTSLPAISSNTNYVDFCAPNPYKSNITPSKVTGMNWVVEQIAESIIKKELKKETKGKFKVTLKARGTGDLINGKFNSLSMVGKNLNLEGIHVSQFSSNTVCDYNSVKLNKDSVEFRENMVMNYELEINNDALSQTLIDTEYVKTLKQFMPINDAKIEIRNNKLYYTLEIPTYITKPIKITVSSGINIKNGRVQLTGLQTSKNSLVNTAKLISVLEKTNPLAFTSDIMDNKNSKVSVDSIKIINDVIHIKGLVLIPKNTES